MVTYARERTRFDRPALTEGEAAAEAVSLTRLGQINPVMFGAFEQGWNHPEMPVSGDRLALELTEARALDAWQQAAELLDDAPVGRDLDVNYLTATLLYLQAGINSIASMRLARNLAHVAADRATARLGTPSLAWSMGRAGMQLAYRLEYAQRRALLTQVFGVLLVMLPELRDPKRYDRLDWLAAKVCGQLFDPTSWTLPHDMQE